MSASLSSLDTNINISGAKQPHLFIGYAVALPVETLPTAGDVMRHAFYLREMESTSAKPQMKKFSEVIDQLAEHIEKQWITASIPEILSRKNLKRKLIRLQDEYIFYSKLCQISYSRTHNQIRKEEFWNTATNN